MGSFAIDLLAMTFGMPRALFPVLAVGVYGAGAEGTGLLYAAVSAGATVAALTTGWLGSARRLGRIVVWAVVAWGAAIAPGRAGRVAVGRRGAARGGRRGRQRQRGLPLDDQPDRHARRDARADVVGLLARRHERPAAGRRRGGRGGGARRPALLRRLRRPGLRRRGRGRRRRLPGARCATTPRRRSRRSPSARPSRSRPERRGRPRKAVQNDEGPARGGAFAKLGCGSSA